MYVHNNYIAVCSCVWQRNWMKGWWLVINAVALQFLYDNIDHTYLLMWSDDLVLMEEAIQSRMACDWFEIKNYGVVI